MRGNSARRLPLRGLILPLDVSRPGTCRPRVAIRTTPLPTGSASQTRQTRGSFIPCSSPHRYRATDPCQVWSSAGVLRPESRLPTPAPQRRLEGLYPPVTAARILTTPPPHSPGRTPRCRSSQIHLRRAPAAPHSGGDTKPSPAASYPRPTHPTAPIAG